MSTALNIAKATNVICDAMLFAESVAERRSENNREITGYSLASRSVNLMFAGGEIACDLMGISASKLEGLKNLEFLARIIGIPFKILDESTQYDGTLKGKLEFIEKGLVAPLADVQRVAIESYMYAEKKYLDLPPGEQETAQRPIYKYSDDDMGGWEIVGYVPFDLKESQELYTYLEKCHIMASSARMLFETLAITSSANKIYVQLATSIIQGKCRGIPKGLSPSSTIDFDTFNLKNFNVIPDHLHEDVIFKRYICPITQCPIRDPVGDPNGKTLYEKKAIIDALKITPCSPMTRKPLSESQLVKKPALKALIDHRLGEHSKELWNLVQKSPLFKKYLKKPAQASLQKAANDENPTY